MNTLVMTDVATGWTEFAAIPYRDQETALCAIKASRRLLPVPLLCLDTDNGTEFLNLVLLAYYGSEQITFTRSRAYRKNDQPHVEQKNGSIVRRMIGYDRYEGIAACRTLSKLHAVLRLYVNFFQPSMRLVSKEKDDGRSIKRYDRAQTPCEGMLASPHVLDEVKDRLRSQFSTLDPVKHLARIRTLQSELWTMAYVPAA